MLDQMVEQNVKGLSLMKIEGMIFFSFYGPAASNLSGDLSEKLELLLLLG